MPNDLLAIIQITATVVLVASVIISVRFTLLNFTIRLRELSKALNNLENTVSALAIEVAVIKKVLELFTKNVKGC